MFNFSQKKSVNILILGDVILDRYIEGHVKRISPEAPVPVLFQTHERDVLGGAGNVASNIHALGGVPVLIGVLGSDDAGNRFTHAAQSLGIIFKPICDKDRTTTIKTRIVGDRQQLLRVDREVLSDITNKIENLVIETVEEFIHNSNAIIISDYRKGLLTPEVLKRTISLANKLSIPVLIDPKGDNYSHYFGADFIKPNRSELELLTKMNCRDREDVAKAASFLSQNTNANILATLSQEGMVLFKKDGSEFSLSTEAKEVFDVSGAGDTAIASFAYALAHNATPENAARFANIASGIAVSKLGTAAVSIQEITFAINQLSARNDSNSEPSVDLVTASTMKNNWSTKGFKVGFTNGCFDLLHPGHIALLREAASACDRLVVGLNSDASVRRLKGELRPIQSEQARAEVLSALQYVDLVTIFDEDTPMEVIKAIQPDVLIKGSDYEEKDIVGAEFVKSYGGQIVRVQLKEGHSTTTIVKRSQLN